MKLGDLIYYITKYSGMKYLVDTYYSARGEKCDCGKRRNKLNKLKIKRW